MKTNNVASYSDVLVTCMRQNPKWILLSEVRSAEAVSAVRNSISSGHNILSTIHADKASAIPYRLYSLMETDLDVNQFLNTIYRYIQLGVHIKAFYSKKYGKFHRELDEVTEFYVDEHNNPVTHTIYRKTLSDNGIMIKPSEHLVEYLENQNINVHPIIDGLEDDFPIQSNENIEYDNASDTKDHAEMPALDNDDANKKNVKLEKSVVKNEQPTVTNNVQVEKPAITSNVVAQPAAVANTAPSITPVASNPVVTEAAPVVAQPVITPVDNANAAPNITRLSE